MGKWFYNNYVNFQIPTGTIDDDGNYMVDYAENLAVFCDVQPIENEVINDKAGGFISAEYKLFCDADELIKDCETAIYQDRQFKVVKITDWDSYYIVYLKAVA